MYVTAGDTVRLEIINTSQYGDFVGVDMAISLRQPTNDFDASLVIGSTANPFSQVTIASALELAAEKDLTVHGRTILANAPISTTGGDVQLLAADAVTVSDGLSTMGGKVSLNADTNGTGGGMLAIAPLTAISFPVLDQFQASGGDYNDRFGSAIAISGDGGTLVAGAYLDDVGGNVDQGSATVFVRSGSDWVQQAVLMPAGAMAGDGIGYSVALSNDGNTAIISAHAHDVNGVANQGSAYIFTRSGSTWTERVQLKASDGAADELFGYAVGLSDDGRTAIVGAPYSWANRRGEFYLFAESGGTWEEQGAFSGLSADDYAGISVALSADGNTAVAGAAGRNDGSTLDVGVVYTVTRVGTTWTSEPGLLAIDRAEGDWFGSAVGLSDDGRLLVVGAPNNDVGGIVDQGSSYVYARAGSSWILHSTLVADDGGGNDVFGLSVAINGDGSSILIGARQDDITYADQGSAYVFGGQDGNWLQQAKLVDPYGYELYKFGASVAVANNGTFYVGSLFGSTNYYAAGSVSVFEHKPSTAGGSISAGNGTIELAGAALNVAGSVTTSGAVQVSATSGYDISLGVTGDSGFHDLELSDVELDRISAASLTFKTLGSGWINVDGSVSRALATNMQLLSAREISFSGGSINTGGGDLVLSPGLTSRVRVSKAGNDVTASTLSFSSNADLLITILGTEADSLYNQLNVVGQVNLTGVDLVLAPSFAPVVGQSFMIVSNDGTDPIIGAFNGRPNGYVFSNFSDSTLSAVLRYDGGDGNDVVLTVIPPVLPGDYNRNNVADAADYVLWRKTLGTTGVSAYSGADGNGSGTIDPGDHSVWRANFGNTAGGSGTAVGQAVRDNSPAVPRQAQRDLRVDGELEAGSAENPLAELRADGWLAAPGAVGQLTAVRSRQDAAARWSTRWDDALVAWLSQRGVVRWEDTAGDVVGGDVVGGEVDGQDCPSYGDGGEAVVEDAFAVLELEVI